MDAVSEGSIGAERRWGLPVLGDRALLFYRCVWALLFVVAIGANVLGPSSNAYLRHHYFEQYSDLGLRQSEGRMLQIPHRPALERAGVVAGSEIIAIGGKAVPASADMEYVADLLRQEASPVAVTIRSPDGRDHALRLARSSHWIDNSYAGTGLTPTSRIAIDLSVAGLANLLLIAASALLFWQRPRDGLAALLALSTLTYAATENLSWYTWRIRDVLDIVPVFSSLGLSGMLIGLVLSPDGRFDPPWSRWAVGLMVAANIFSFFGERLSLPIWATILPFILSIVGLLAAMRARFRRTPITSPAWQQQRWLLLGMSVAIVFIFVTFALNNLTNIALLNRQQLVWAYISAGLTLSMITVSLVAGMLVALLRYRLYDSDAALSRSAGLALVGLLFAALFAGFAKGIEIATDAAFGGSNAAVPGIAAAVLATVMVTPLQERIQRWADSRFRKALDHLRRDLPACVDDLRETATLEELLDELLVRVTDGVRATAAAVEVEGVIVASRGSVPPSWSLRLPLTVEHRHAGEEGWLLVGPRPDGSMPGKDEREALSDVLDSVSRAIRVVRAREQRDRRQRGLIEELSQRLGRLEARLA